MRRKKNKIRGVRNSKLQPVYDARSGGGTMFRGDELPTPEFLRRVAEELLEFADGSVLPWPLKRVEHARGEYAQKRNDVLDVLYLNRAIGDVEMAVGREFQACAVIAHECSVPSSLVERSGGGGSDIAYVLQRRLDAGRKVNDYLDSIGPINNIARLTVDAVVGRELSLRKMVEHYGQNTSYWRCAVICGLETLSHKAVKRARKKRFDTATCEV